MSLYTLWNEKLDISLSLQKKLVPFPVLTLALSIFSLIFKSTTSNKCSSFFYAKLSIVSALKQLRVLCKYWLLFLLWVLWWWQWISTVRWNKVQHHFRRHSGWQTNLVTFFNKLNLWMKEKVQMSCFWTFSKIWVP